MTILTPSLRQGFAYGTDVDVANIIRWYDHQIYLKDPRDPGLQRDLPGFRINPRFWSDDPAATCSAGWPASINPAWWSRNSRAGPRFFRAHPLFQRPCCAISPAGGLPHLQRWERCGLCQPEHFVRVLARGGKRTISLPEKAKVVDLLENRVVSEGAAEFSLAMAPNSTVLLGIQH